MNNFMGVEIYENASLPERRANIELKQDVMVTDEFRVNFNKWLLDRFGSVPVLIMMPGMRRIFTHPNNMVEIKRNLFKNNDWKVHQYEPYRE